jgi:N-methylhydantoinase A/acetophenone carboxylase
MKYKIHIDIGGTFTDCFTVYNGSYVTGRTPTTPYNLSVGFIKSIEDCARRLKISKEEILKNTESIIYSTTIAMNKLLERKGPFMGLVTTEGFEDTTFIGKGSAWTDGLTQKEARNLARASRAAPLVQRDMVVGTKGRIDYQGKIIRPLDEDDTRDKLQYLIDRGARTIVVCSLFSFVNPIHEKRIREIFLEEYPESYLGNVPIILSSDVVPKRFEYTRSMTTILNAYLHQNMSEDLISISDSLRDMGYTKPIVMVHNTGGMARVFRTAAVQTYNGGPVSGLIGGHYWGKIYGFDNVVVTDMGGTSFDLGIISKSSLRFYTFRPVIDRWLVDQTMLETKSIGAGGGSIARLNPLLGNRIEVGPESAGSVPGPAAYDQGGEEATVTDADIVLGYINPEYFHGGKKKLNKKRATEAIRKKIAEPLGIELENAATLVKDIIDGHMGNEIYRETVLSGYDPRDFALFAYGGGGPTHCCGYEKYIGADRIVTFSFAPIFCAFGSSIMEVMHIYEQSKHIVVLTPVKKQLFTDYEEFNSMVRTLQEKAYRDFEAEGLPLEKLRWSLELDMKFGGQLNVKRTASPTIFVNNEKDVNTIIDAFIKEYSETFSPLGIYPEGGINVENFVLKASYPVDKFKFKRFELEGDNPEKGRTGQREVFWKEKGYIETPVYNQELLSPGNTIKGPAIIEAEDTTIVLPADRTYRMDEYKNGVIVRSN